MHHSKSALLTTIAHILKKGDNTYCYASQDTYLGLLKSIHNVDISARCLRKHIHELVKQKYIKSTRRWGHADDGTIHNRTSAICLTPKACIFLFKSGFNWAIKLLRKIIKIVQPEQPSTIHTSSAGSNIYKEKRTPLKDLLDPKFYDRWSKKQRLTPAT